MQTMPDLEDPEIVAKRAKQKRAPKVSLSSERKKAEASIRSLQPPPKKLSPSKITQKPPTPPVAVVQKPPPTLPPPPKLTNLEDICQKYEWKKDNIPSVEIQKLIKEKRLSKNALLKKIEKDGINLYLTFKSLSSNFEF